MRTLFTAPLLAGCIALLCTAPANAGKRGMASHTTGLEGLHPLRRERGKLCMTDHYHFGDGASRRSKSHALIAARRDWAAFVGSEYGSAWANLSLAGSKGRKCSRKNGQFICSISARPCRH